MKNVLIITFPFPPRHGIGGMRMQGLAKYLPEFGWKPIILTPKLPGEPERRFRIIQTPYYDITTAWKKRFGLKPNETFRKRLGVQPKKKKKTLAEYFLTFAREIIEYPDAKKGWYPYAVEAARELMRQEKVDALISSSKPETCHLIAKNLKVKYNVPWIADFRDLWTQNHYYYYSPLRKLVERRLEMKTLNVADALVTVSRPLAEKLKRLHKGKKIYVILNGFDPAEKSVGVPLSDKFSIVYTGSLYKGRQDPEPIFKAFHELILEGIIDPEDIGVDFYGYNESWLEEDIKKYGLQSIVEMHDRIPREEALRKQRQAQLLLLFTWGDPKELGIYTGKLFEYLAAQRPILSIGAPGGVAAELLKETKAGIHASNIEEIKNFLKESYHEFKTNREVGYRGINSKIDNYNQKEMAKKFASALNRL